MKILFILYGRNEAISSSSIELQLQARSEKEAIAKAKKIALREKYEVKKVFQQEDNQKIGILEDLVDAIKNIEFSHNR